MSAPVQPRVGREAVGQTRIPHQGAAASVGPFVGGVSPRLLPQQNQLSAREPQGQKKSCRFSGRTSFVVDGKIRLQGALFPSPMGRPLPRNRPFDFSTRIKDRRGKLGGPATKPRSVGLFTFEFPPLLGGSSLTLSGEN